MNLGDLRQLIQNLDDVPDDALVCVHVATEGGWALVELEPRLGLTPDNGFVALCCELDQPLEPYEDEVQGATTDEDCHLRLVK